MSTENVLSQLSLDLSRERVEEIRIKSEDARALLERVDYLERLSAKLLGEFYRQGANLDELIPFRKRA